MTTELETARELALRAGAILLEHYGQATSIEWKGKDDPVTAADRSASRFIVDELRKRFPNDGILCEEEQDNFDRLGKARVWIIDPMDGTKDFISGSGEFAVMIGLAEGGEAILGAVYQPTEQKLYSASRGAGAYLTHGEIMRELHVSEENDPAKTVMALSRSHLSATTEAIRKKLGIEHTIRTGSLGLKVGLLCEGQAHVYIHGSGTKLWDTCAPEAILREAGGMITDQLGQSFMYNVEEVRNLHGVIASNAVFHDRAVEASKLHIRRQP